MPPFCRLLLSMEMVQLIPTRALSRARGFSMRTHLTLWTQQAVSLHRGNYFQFRLCEETTKTNNINASYIDSVK